MAKIGTHVPDSAVIPDAFKRLTEIDLIRDDNVQAIRASIPDDGTIVDDPDGTYFIVLDPRDQLALSAAKLPGQDVWSVVYVPGLLYKVTRH